MRIRKAVFTAAAVAALAACDGNGYGPSSPSGNGNGGDGDGDGGGGPAGSVTVGSGIEFVSRHNGSMNPAVDTIAVGDTMRWTWSGALPHSVRSVGSPSFTSSGTLTGSGSYAVGFTAPGTYRYDCAVHGASMTGTIVVVGSAAPTTTQTVTDPVGDTYDTGGVQWDLTAMTVAHDTGGITVQLDFTSDVLSPASLDTSAIIGYVELDLDQSEVSGGGSVVDEFRNNEGAAHLGVDATIDLTLYARDSSVAVYDARQNVVGRVKPVFDGNRITIRVSRAIIDDDGVLGAAAIIGDTHRPTDFAPNDGHLTLGGAAQVVSAQGAAAVQRPASVAPAWRRAS